MKFKLLLLGLMSMLALPVMALEQDEAVFINVIGNIKPDELGKVMENFDIDMGQGMAKGDAKDDL